MKAVNWGIVILALFSILVISGCSNSPSSSSQTANQPATVPSHRSLQQIKELSKLGTYAL